MIALALAVLVLVAAPTALAAPPAKRNPDLTPPATSVVSGPANLSTVAGAVTFAFAANEPATFACSLDGSPYGACTTATTFTVPNPVFGPHVFSVRATDTAGNVDAKPPYVLWFSPYASTQTYLPTTLLGTAQANPTQVFDVIVQLKPSANASAVAQAAQAKSNGNQKAKVKAPFRSINGFQAKLPGWVLLYVADWYPVLSITPNTQVKLDDYRPAQSWQKTIAADRLWTHAGASCATDATTGLQADPTCVPLAPYTAADAPTIAVVDSGIDGSKADDFGARIVGHTVLESKGVTNADDCGHGTFVASIAAGAANAYPGVAPTAKLYDLRVIGADGSADTSDVIAAADWLLQNKDTYNIKVANFSLHSSRPNSFRFDPLDRAVESLWFNGVVVVAAAGNFGIDANTPIAMDFAPGNDPFAITVGAADQMGTTAPADDTIAPWSAWGYTADGFAKPELSAPGRYMIGAIPPASMIATQRADHVVAPGYIQLSGTSFAAPAVAGAAANLLALHPTWTPDQVKGALMATARPLTLPNRLATGLGEIDEAAAAAVSAPPAANAALEKFVVADATVAGGVSFAGQSWVSAAQADQSWAAQSWADQSWAAQSWSDQSWASQSWSDSSQADAALADQSWVSASVVD